MTIIMSDRIKEYFRLPSLPHFFLSFSRVCKTLFSPLQQRYHLSSPAGGDHQNRASQPALRLEVHLHEEKRGKLKRFRL